MVHRCEGVDEKDFPKWNHVISSTSGADMHHIDRHFCCVMCYKKAPDSMITVLELYR